MEDPGSGKIYVELPFEKSGEPGARSATLPQDYADLGMTGLASPLPEAIPVLESPALPVQLPATSSVPAPLKHPGSSFDKRCTPTQAPVVDYGFLIAFVWPNP